MKRLSERIERRRDRRLPVSLGAVLRAPDGRWARHAHVKDLHRFGARACVEDMDILAEDDPVLVEFDLDSEKGEALGRVRWTLRGEGDSLHCGVTFDEPLSIKLPLDTVQAAFARLQEEAPEHKLNMNYSLLEKITLAMHGETWAGGLLNLFAIPAQHALNALGTRLELDSLRLQRALSETHALSAKASLHPLLLILTDVFQDLQTISKKIKEFIRHLNSLHGSLLLEPDNYVRQVDPAELMRQSVTFMEALCGFLGGKMASLRFRTAEGALPLLGVRPLDLRRSLDACLLGMMESALCSQGTTITVGPIETESWVGVQFGHDGFRMMQAQALRLRLDDAGFIGETSSRDERTALRFYHAILPLREYGVFLNIYPESGRNRVQLRLPLTTRANSA
ncbi:MAG: PilZ domain-containing protein [Desulfosoma sp.]